MPLSTATELFVYRDLASLRDWEAHGARPENAAAMIHLLANGEGLTIVVGDPDERVAAGVLEEVPVALLTEHRRGAVQGRPNVSLHHAVARAELSDRHSSSQAPHQHAHRDTCATHDGLTAKDVRSTFDAFFPPAHG